MDTAAVDLTRPLPALGWKEEQFDGRDKYYVPKHIVPLTTLEMPFSLRKNTLYKDFFADNYNQGSWNTCVANACAAAFACERKRQGLDDLDPSRLFIYWHARNAAFIRGDMEQDPSASPGSSQGCNVRWAMKVLNKLGTCADSEWRYTLNNFKLKPDDAVKEAAKHNISLEYSRLDQDNPGVLAGTLSDHERDTIGAMALLRLRQCISEGIPVVFGFKIYRTHFLVKRGEDWTMVSLPGREHRPTPTADHAVLAIGFDDVKNRVLCQNSRGKSQDSMPFFYVGYDWIRDFDATADFWMLRYVAQDGDKGQEVVVPLEVAT